MRVGASRRPKVFAPRVRTILRKAGIKKAIARRSDTKPGMISKAAADFDIDLRRSWVIGDNEPDIKLAANAGLRSVLVRTGYGGALAAQEHVCANIVAADLYEAAERIISGNGES